jgi:hypothetical protein
MLLRGAQGNFISAIPESASNRGFNEVARWPVPSKLLDCKACYRLREASKLASQHHPGLLRADLARFLAAVRNTGTQVTAEKLLHQTKLTKKKSWGFSIGIADWKVIGQDLETLEEVIQSKMNGTRRVSFLGQRGYEGTWFGDKVNWMADFIAEMPDFSPEPTADRFRYGLRLKWSWSEKELSENELEEYVDHASTWWVLGEDDLTDLKEELKGRFGRKARIDLELYFEDPVFRELLAAARLLRAAIDHRWERIHIQEAFRKMRPLWTKSLQMRAVGNYLMLLVETSDALDPGAVERSFRISFVDSEETVLLTTSRNRS